MILLVHSFQGDCQPVVAHKNYPNDPRYLASALSKCFVAVDNIEGVVGSKHQVPLPARAGLLVESNVE